MNDTFFKSGATLSECRKYRYALWRIWDTDKDNIMFIGLNPSIADETKDDPTTRRCVQFAKDWGYGGVYLVNLFAYRTKSPSDLWVAPFPISEPKDPSVNDNWLKGTAEHCTKIVFSWGNDGDLNQRYIEVQKMFPESFCFGLTMSGQPKHPLYISGDTPLLPFSVNFSYIKLLDDTNGKGRK
ncbi:MAG: DUF1643 domain-containing protein [Bacteroidota bacterium]